jgi:hypothetical protein
LTTLGVVIFYSAGVATHDRSIGSWYASFGGVAPPMYVHMYILTFNRTAVMHNHLCLHKTSSKQQKIGRFKQKTIKLRFLQIGSNSDSKIVVLTSFYI